MSTSIRSLLGNQIHELSLLYSPEEAKELAYRLAEHLLGWNRSQLLLELDSPSPEVLQIQLGAALRRLLQSEPLQYIVGEVEFYDCTFEVSPNVLIPRPETEELVDIIAKDWYGKTPDIMDLGTGSGCIPIALAKSLSLSSVTAVDVSAEALEVARRNALRNGVEVEFILADMRKFGTTNKFDVIVSNPPYVTESEKGLMRNNVLNYEPHLALFVHDEDPLEFYRAVARFAATQLKKEGRAYVEINQQFGEDTALLFRDFGMEAEVHKDIFGVDRFVIAQWKRNV